MATRPPAKPPGNVDHRRLVWAFWIAAALSVGLHFAQPYGRYALYPFAFLATWSHEMGHGLTAILFGGEFRHLELYQNLGGVAWHTATGWERPFVAMGGLLGPAVTGGMTIVLGARVKTARWVIAALALGLVVSAAIWVRPIASFGFWVTVGIAVAALLVARFGSETVKVAAAQLVGIQLCLGSLGDFDYMFIKGFVRDGKQQLSDTGSIAEAWLLPYWFWGALVAALSILIMAWAFKAAWVRPKPKAKTKAAAG